MINERPDTNSIFDSTLRESRCDVIHFSSELVCLKCMDCSFIDVEKKIDFLKFLCSKACIYATFFTSFSFLASRLTLSPMRSFLCAAEWQSIYAPQNIYITYCGPPTLHGSQWVLHAHPHTRRHTGKQHREMSGEISSYGIT